jgi:hypothetical protein
MDPERARESLAQERERIERSLARLGHEDTGEPADEFDPANQASDLYQDELDEGLADDLREELAAVERAEARLAAVHMAARSRAASPSRTSASRPFRPLSGRSRRKRAEKRGLAPTDRHELTRASFLVADPRAAAAPHESRPSL